MEWYSDTDWCYTVQFCYSDFSHLVTSAQTALVTRFSLRWYYAGCTLSPSAFGESLGRELPKTRLGECDSLHSCRELSIHEARARRGRTDESENKAHVRNFGFFVSKFWGFFPKFWCFSNFYFFFENYNLPKCICRLFLSDECVDDFGVRHKATAMEDTRPFDSCITDC